MIIHYLCILIIIALSPLEGQALVSATQKTGAKARASSADGSAHRKIPCEKAEPSEEPPPPPPPTKGESSIPANLPRKTTLELERAIRKCVEPAYPPLAKAARVSGAVKVEVVVDEQGDVISARAVSGHPLLKDAAVVTALKWKFEPAVVKGRPIKVVGTIKFTFRL